MMGIFAFSVNWQPQSTESNLLMQNVEALAAGENSNIVTGYRLGYVNLPDLNGGTISRQCCIYTQNQSDTCDEGSVGCTTASVPS